ncbi:hypothetical protein BHF71_03010 [Vulcanibacillus modesticaldus]|uniref:DUF1292 domain-containing protein n=2 Tax=Vulcanibacillus modesticaldus TaxID=337097 RepID=A0A1D2YTC2_9BACI|nr:hypothetical protein BHF71_03010 [Vulcanibacillus modesticaldus]
MNIKETDLLREKYGSEITLYDEEDQEHLFHLLMELEFDGKHYAYFQSPDAEEGEIEVLKVEQLADGELELRYIDDNEWEDASEIFDIWTNKYD